MSKEKIGNSDLKSLGIKEIFLLKLFGRTAKKLRAYHKLKKPEIMEEFRKLLVNPVSYINYDNELSQVASELIQYRKTNTPESNKGQNYQLLPKPIEFKIYGKEQIEGDALKQMQTAMQLPITEAGALMPDAHTGYGLPIGGVLATKNDVVIPYAVGVDIACRMCLTIFDLPAFELERQNENLISALEENTIFGVGNKCANHFDNSVFDLPEWNLTKIIRQHRDLAFSQLGTSGAGNHFAEWGKLEINESVNELNIPKGNYVALLSHSGSRGFGSEIASYYSRLAMLQTKLPNEARHLAWLNLNSEEGQEYWIAMNLAGKYASANHHEIHNKISKYLGLRPLAKLENHHNFAWKEKLSDGKEVIVHRKGATPAKKGDIGIIPGSMTLPGFVIKGKGNLQSINSASHGAGRVMSRNQAYKNYTREDMLRQLKKFKVELIGGDIDEAPMVYKNIETVMDAQIELVEILAKFYPKIVRMADPDRRRRR